VHAIAHDAYVSRGAVVQRHFFRGEREEIGIGNGVDESEAEERRPTAMRDDRCGRRNRIGRKRVKTGDVARSNRVILHERSAELRERIESAIRRRAEASDGSVLMSDE